MFAQLIAAGVPGVISYEACYPSGPTPSDGPCMNGGLPFGGCRYGAIPHPGGICKLGGTRIDV